MLLVPILALVLVKTCLASKNSFIQANTNKALWDKFPRTREHKSGGHLVKDKFYYCICLTMIPEMCVNALLCYSFDKWRFFSGRI